MKKTDNEKTYTAKVCLLEALDSIKACVSELSRCSVVDELQIKKLSKVEVQLVEELKKLESKLNEY